MKDRIELFDGEEIGGRLFNPGLGQVFCNISSNKTVELQIMEKLLQGPNSSLFYMDGWGFEICDKCARV